MMLILKWVKRILRNSRHGCLVAERLRGEDLRGKFVNRVVRSMKEYPDEWEVKDWIATHVSGVVVDARGYANLHGDPGRMCTDKLFASVTVPTLTILSKEESEILGDAFDYLTKLKVLEMLRMDGE